MNEYNCKSQSHNDECRNISWAPCVAFVGLFMAFEVVQKNIKYIEMYLLEGDRTNNLETLGSISQGLIQSTIFDFLVLLRLSLTVPYR